MKTIDTHNISGTLSTELVGNLSTPPSEKRDSLYLWDDVIDINIDMCITKISEVIDE